MATLGIGSNYPVTKTGSPSENWGFRQLIGEAADWIGGKAGIPETGISEWLAGGPTSNTGNYVKATDEGYKVPETPTPLNPNYNPQPNPTPQPQQQQPSGSYSFNMGDFQNYAGWNPEAALADWKAKGSPMPGGGSGSGGGDPYAGLRSEISSGYDNYIQQLNDTMNSFLPGQVSNMNQIIGNQFQSGQAGLRQQEQQGLADLQGERESATANQNKNLKDLAENIRNMFMSGNVYLGSRGAGDSSAANQYAYALTKVGNKARGDVTSQTAQIQAEIGKRETGLKQTVETELQNLAREKDNKVLEVANWFSEQQMALKERMGQAGLSKSTDLANLSRSILDQSMQRLAQVEQDVRSRQGMLQEWAVNQSKTIGELKNNLAAVSQFSPQLPQAQQFSGTPTISGGNMSLPINWSTNNSDEEKNKGLFG